MEGWAKIALALGIVVAVPIVVRHIWVSAEDDHERGFVRGVVTALGSLLVLAGFLLAFEGLSMVINPAFFALKSLCGT